MHADDRRDLTARLSGRCRLDLWTLAFYAPAVALPLATRALVLSRHRDDLALAAALKGAAFGALQDAAVLLQALTVARLALRLSRARVLSAVALALAFLLLSLACAVDLVLVMQFLPRLNRSLVAMGWRFSSQFASSLDAVATPAMALGAVAYVVCLALWVAAVLCDKAALPRFQLAVCASPSPSVPSSKRRVSVQHVGLAPWLAHAVTTSVVLRTAVVALVVSASALHATIALDGNGHDITLFSNAMFALETESVVRAATQETRMATTRHTAFRPRREEEEEKTRSASASRFLERMIGRHEDFELLDADASPFWRTTRRFTGAKRFAWPSRPATPPTVLVLNLESFRSREVGVLGGLERHNQTVTPFFDALSTTGVLFSKHYTPCVQTSRTLLSSLFGVLPSMKDASAVSTFPDSKLRLHGLPHILKRALNYTSVFWSAVNLAWEDWRGFLLANGFDALVDDVQVLDYLSQARRDGLTADDAFSWGRHDPVSFDALTTFLQQRRSDPQPLFLDVYSVSSHDPWKLPSSFRPSANYSRFLTPENENYVHALNFVDQCLEKLITTLRQEQLLNNTVLLIEGDHGYGRMEHGNNPTIVASAVYDEGTHVPMLLLADDILSDADKGTVVHELTSQTDLLATITDLVGIQNFEQHGMGQSMLRKRDPHDGEREVVLTNPFYGQTRGLRVGRDLKYVRYGSGKYEVFNLTSDPLELAPVESGKLPKHPDGRVQIDSTVLANATTIEALRFMEDAVEVTSLVYETNGFKPSTDGSESVEMEAQRQQMRTIVYKSELEDDSGSHDAQATVALGNAASV